MKIVVGLSGGVDSSVAAWLLKQQGHEVIGMFMINWHDTTGTLYGDCPWKDDLVFAQLVARKLDIPLHTVDLSKQYRQRVVDYMFEEYQKGRTPNPDVLCNREIKFDLFIQEAKKLGAEKVATGHYAQCYEEEIDGKIYYRLLQGIDNNKDQSYFLCQLSQSQLALALFPVGNLTKPEVRRIADSLNLPTAQRKDSQGICFVGKVDLPTFLQQKIAAKRGPIIEIPSNSPVFQKDVALISELAQPYMYRPIMGKIVGYHNGAHFFTIGQRKGLHVGGKKEPLFVIGIDVDSNILYVGEGENHPGLYRKALYVSEKDIHWVRPDYELEPMDSQRCRIRVRSRRTLHDASVIKMEEGLVVLFDQPQRGITPGQFVAWYDGDELVGSGIING
ncbi:MAG: tRNA 2-thiouridine(34) synthase MnmA [Bacteroidales bacterium]|nr:tRNA 2-thiouridine(34) synthase MnmA [Bacteroidales bacterium]